MIQDYDSPISLFMKSADRIGMELGKAVDDKVYSAIVEVGINVDKEKMLQILTEDKRRYQEAFWNGHDKGKQIGTWEPVDEDEVYCCSVCHRLQMEKTKYCPECGARMALI